MKIELDGKEYSGLAAMLIAIPSFVFVGMVLLGIGIMFTSPLWLLVLIARAFA